MHRFNFASRLSMAALVAATVMVRIQAAQAADLPGIKASASNAVPACTTPGRLQAYLAKRNPSLDPRFKTIAADYMREGEALGLRWDMAFFQMMLETGALSYANGARIAGVKLEQNNFAGLRPIEKNAGYESFADVASGVRAHLQHVTLYSGGTVDAPVAQRTRKLQEIGTLADWHKTLKHEVTYSDLAQKWTDGSGTYAGRLEDLAGKFNAEFCNAPDPQPELMSSLRGSTGMASAEAAAPAQAAVAAPSSQPKVSGAELARRAIETGSDQRSGLGAVMPVKILNAPLPEASTAEATPAVAAPAAPAQADKLPVPQLPRMKSAAQQPPATKTAAAGSVAKAVAPIAEPPAKAPDVAPPAQEAPAGTMAASNIPATIIQPSASAQKCRVFTASYGGQRAVIVKAVVDQVANFTVLDVNEGQEGREAEAFIAAYAKGGSVAGQFTTQDKALEKAFELCPEG